MSEEEYIRKAVRICATHWYAEARFEHSFFRYMDLEDEIVKLVKQLKGGEKYDAEKIHSILSD